MSRAPAWPVPTPFLRDRESFKLAHSFVSLLCNNSSAIGDISSNRPPGTFMGSRPSTTAR